VRICRGPAGPGRDVEIDAELGIPPDSADRLNRVKTAELPGPDNFRET